MRIFITGASGVIGVRVVPLLVAEGHQVTAVGRSAEKRAMLNGMGASPVQVDLFDSVALRRAVVGHNAIVNLATHIPGTAQMFLPGAWRTNDRIRREVSAALVDAALAGGTERFIQESFGLIYPDRGDNWIDESTPIQPLPYSKSVADAERSAQRITSGGGAGVVLRFAAFYGPDSPQTRQLISYVRRGWVPIPGAPESFFSSVSHDDAAAAVVAALGLPAGVYNVADDEPLRRRELFDSLATALGVAPPRLPPAWMTPLLGSLGATLARSERIANRKLCDASGWRPRYPSARKGWPDIVKALRASA